MGGGGAAIRARLAQEGWAGGDCFPKPAAQAQLTVLQNNDYKFHTVFLNPGANKKQLLDVLSRRQWRFPFHLKIHHCDAKSVANHLAKLGKRSCILIPADFLAVLQVRVRACVRARQWAEITW